MKKIVTLALSFLIVYSIYYDLTTGTLPAKTIQAEAAAIDGIQFVTVLVEPGDTVLSIVEHLHDGPIQATIQEIVYDFKKLNKLEHEKIKIGDTYRFPIYE